MYQFVGRHIAEGLSNSTKQCSSDLFMKAQEFYLGELYIGTMMAITTEYATAHIILCNRFSAVVYIPKLQ